MPDSAPLSIVLVEAGAEIVTPEIRICPDGDPLPEFPVEVLKK
jgi:hypothetical protein